MPTCAISSRASTRSACGWSISPATRRRARRASPSPEPRLFHEPGRRARMSFRPLLEQVRALASGERARATVEELARHHRVQASPGYDRAAQWLAGELERIGLVPQVETVMGDG